MSSADAFGHLAVVYKHLTGSTSDRPNLFEWYPGLTAAKHCVQLKHGEKHLNKKAFSLCGG